MMNFNGSTTLDQNLKTASAGSCGSGGDLGENLISVSSSIHDEGQLSKKPCTNEFQFYASNGSQSKWYLKPQVELTPSSTSSLMMNGDNFKESPVSTINAIILNDIM